MLGGLALLLAACGTAGGQSTSKGSTIQATQTGGTITVGLDEGLSGFNVNTSADNSFSLEQILDVVWPSVYTIGSNLKPVLNTQLVTSAAQVSTNPQTVVYHINPKAVWADGVPISASDFIYNWHAMSGNAKYKDVGGKPFDDASTAGYSQIKSITGSDGGKTVTVVFSTPYADWKSLFGAGQPIVPAHIAQRVGWNTGFNDWHNALSGSWYEIQSYVPGQYLTLVRNPRYWSTPGRLSKIVFRFVSQDSQLATALADSEINVFSPTSVNLSILDQVKQMPGTQSATESGLEFEHLDFNQANPYLAKLAVRRAIAYGANRQQIIDRTVGLIDKSIKPLGNRFYMPNQSGYENNGAAYPFDPSKAKALLRGSGMTMGADGYFHPSFGPQAGKDLTLTLSSTTGNSLRAQTEELFQADMKAIGVKIEIHNYTPATLFGSMLPKGEFDILEAAFISTPFPSGFDSTYCSYTNTANCGNNFDHYSDPAEDRLLNAGATATTPKAEQSDYNQADKVLWKDMVTLPLYQTPQFFAWSSRYANIIPNTSALGIPWNAEQWGLKPSS